MERSELYSKINECGVLPFQYMLYLLDNISVDNPSIVPLLKSRLKSNGRMMKSDWEILINNVDWNNETMSKEIALQWINRCGLNRWEFIQILENIVFTDGSDPVYLITEDNQFIIEE